MKPIVVSDVLAVGEVPSVEQIEILAKAGFRSVINNQPDGEVDRLPGSEALGAAARRHGLAYAHAPLSSRTPEARQLEAYAEAIRALPAPIFAFCYSGARSAAGCALLLAERTEPDAIIAQLGEAGHDVASLKPWLDEVFERHGGAGRRAANGNGHAPAAAAAPGASEARPTPPAKPEVAPPAMPAAKAVEGIVVLPRAMGFGGFAM